MYHVLRRGNVIPYAASSISVDLTAEVTFTSYSDLQDEPSLSDIVVGNTAKAAIGWLKEGEAVSFPMIEAYVKRLEGVDAFAKAASGVEKFREVSYPNVTVLPTNIELSNSGSHDFRELLVIPRGGTASQRGKHYHWQDTKGIGVKAGLQASLLAVFDAAMVKAWPLAKEAGVTTSGVVKCINYKFGDFQCNAAMSLFKALKVT